jgi:hypothetical protein
LNTSNGLNKSRKPKKTLFIAPQKIMTSTINSPLVSQHTNPWFDVFFNWSVLIGTGLIVGLGFWYVILLNGLSTRGFALGEMKSQQAKIYKEIEQLDILLTIPASIYALESSEYVQEMSDIKTQKYFFVRNGEVALR